MSRLLSALLLTAVAASPVVAQTNINFDGTAAPCIFASTSPLTNLYAPQGVGFAGNGAILNQCGNFGINARSGTDFWAFNIGTYATGPGMMTFASPVSSVSLWAYSLFQSSFTLTLFDALSNTLASTVVAANNSAYVLLDLAASGATSAQISSTGEYWVVDDLAFNRSVSVPEPGTWLLLVTGLLGLGFATWRRKQGTLA